MQREVQLARWEMPRLFITTATPRTQTCAVPVKAGTASQLPTVAVIDTKRTRSTAKANNMTDVYHRVLRNEYTS